jgi:hypothetical protein
VARYNEILVGRYNRQFQKLFSMKGDAPSPQLAGEIQPGFPLFSGVENRYTEGWETFSIGVFVAAVAADFGACSFRNPTGSGMIAVVESLLVIGDGTHADAPNWQRFEDNADEASAVNTVTTRLDGRTRNQPSIVVSKGNPVSIVGTLLQQGIITVNNQGWWFIFTDIQEAPLLPGSRYRIQSNIANQAITVSARWRERTLEDSEKF